FGCARIEHSGDMWMIHQGQGLAFGLESTNDLFGVHTNFNDLERYAASDRLPLLGQVNSPHPAFTQDA
ncbi:MAG: hypothetical protein IIC50_23175, partial [Planctomycetes bacterium]|nr:hypothetical protein [Planctomycetota bacterium]